MFIKKKTPKNIREIAKLYEYVRLKTESLSVVWIFFYYEKMFIYSFIDYYNIHSSFKSWGYYGYWSKK